ncbi:MAG: diadenylate cyclase, partial [Lachnospiraceae bacterium]|nr:diadenylate cyclase [Lachnospiraceae bacterium]
RQLLKGVLLIMGFILVCSFLGLEMVGYLFNKLLYIVAILFVVIFQPELRHALETVGLKSFSSLSSVIVNEDGDEQLRFVSMVDEIVKACTEMSKTYTGAIMLIERSTRLGELLKQENVVLLDSSVTNSMLQSIFYKGSPMHDGALLIRDGRIVAARCHVPLAETFHSLERYGTRHRAAVGASEIGDTIAIVVSEERGTMSIAVEGVLYEMKDGQELKKNLSYLLGLSNSKGRLTVRSKKNSKKTKKQELEAQDAPILVTAKNSETKNSDTKKAEAESVPVVASRRARKGAKKSGRVWLLLISFLFSIFLWMYIQVTTNPVTEKTYTLPLRYENDAMLTERNLTVNNYPIVQEVTVRIVGRKNVIDKLNTSNLEAYIDFAEVNSTGSWNMLIKVKCSDSVYFRVDMQKPEDIYVSVNSVEND